MPIKSSHARLPDKTAQTAKTAPARSPAGTSAGNFKLAKKTKRSAKMLVLSELLNQSSFSQIVNRHQQSKRIQHELDRLLPLLNLPNALVCPGKKINEFMLNVHSAAEATLLRNQIPQLQSRLKPRLSNSYNNLRLRVRNRPSVRQMQQLDTNKLTIPAKIRRKLEASVSNLSDPGLRKSVQQLLDNT